MKLLTIMLICLSLVGCTRSNSYGKCIGALGTPDTKYDYKLSYWNVFVAFVFSGSLIVPAIVILDDLKCPGPKQ